MSSRWLTSKRKFLSFLLFFAGFGIILFFSIGNSIIQTQSPDHLRGRLMGIWALIFGGSMPIGSFWMGAVGQRVGSGHALQAGGLFCALGASTVYFLGREKRGGGGHYAGQYNTAAIKSGIKILNPTRIFPFGMSEDNKEISIRISPCSKNKLVAMNLSLSVVVF